MNKKIGKLIIITGFSGSGKDTLMNMLLKEKPNLKRVVTHTSRPVRDGEKDGVDYHFVNKNRFKDMIAKKLLVEHVLYGSHYKGTSKKEFTKVLEGKNLIWRIDMSRAAIIEETFRKHYDQNIGNMLIKRTIKFLIKTSNPHVALRRYEKREKDKADIEEFKKRLNQDVQIWLNNKHSFPHVIENKTGKQKQALLEILNALNL